MALASIIRQAAAAAFEIADDLLATFTFQARTLSDDSAYDYRKGSRPVDVSTFDLRGILLDQPTRSVEGGIAKEGDIALLIQSSTLGDTVAVNTSATDSVGKEWFVAFINKDPANATTEFLLRSRN